MASFALVSKYGMPPFDWQKAWARFDEICVHVSNCGPRDKGPTHHSLALLHIDLVADNDLLQSVPVPARTRGRSYEWEALWVHRARLHQELVAPAVQCVEALRIVDVVYEHAAVGAAVERNT
jgi:hypothetical protein